MSTPIETNTEELQEILQTVYNLPLAGGGGSSEPDLVIGFNVADTTETWFGNVQDSDISIVSGSVSAVAEKVSQGIPTRVTLKEVNFYNTIDWSIGLAEASHVSVKGSGVYPGTLSGILTVVFIVINTPHRYEQSHYVLRISFDSETGEVVDCDSKSL